MELATDRLILRELEERDAARLAEIESLPEVWRFLMGERSTPEKAEEYITGIQFEAAVIPRRVFDFAVTIDGHLIGRAGFKRSDHELRDAMLWYALDPAYHRKGYATEAVRALVAFGFDRLGLHRMWADADPRNPPSIRVMERLGMRREAHHLENVCIRDEWCDSVIYAMLRREWQP